MIEVKLPDGSSLEVENGATAEDVAYKIGTGLGDDTKAAKINGGLVAKEAEVSNGDEIELVTSQSDEYVEVLRHSAAHVFAQALKRLYPEAKLTIGPWTDEGFYYDVDGVEIEKEELEEIEEECHNIIEEDLEIEQIKVSRDDAEDFFSDNKFKREIMEDEAAGSDEMTFYEQGEFKDLCKGPHVDSTGEIGGFKLLEIAGAYWRGDENNEMLTRIYGTAFPTQKELDEFIERREEAKKRDHRKIGKQMDLFSIPDFSPGTAHFHPNGMTIRRELEDFIRNKNDKLGYTEVRTPELNKAELWKKTGHYQAFKEEDEMFFWEQKEIEWGLKPMNCANHSHIYNSKKRSYRDLPIRLSEFGNVYRFEQSGEISGLLRVRGMTQDDGHAYIREDQIQGEVERTLDIIKQMYDEFGFEITFKLETKPDKAQGPDKLWEKAEESLEQALKEKNADYSINDGEGAFYGPKIGVMVEDAIGREWQLGTVQLDFVIPRNYGLKYTGKDNDEHYPVMIHRAILGSLDRFMGVMIEHYEGRFPLWLAPEQIRILPVTDENLDYARELQEELSEFRVEIEDRSWTVGKKIQAAHDDRLPYMIIIGDDEEEAEEISVRDRFENEDRGFSVEEFKEHLHSEVEEKRQKPDFLS